MGCECEWDVGIQVYRIVFSLRFRSSGARCLLRGDHHNFSAVHQNLGIEFFSRPVP